MQSFYLSCLLLTIFNVINTVAVPTIQAVGSKFFFSDGRQFFMKGVAYQLTEDDPLVDVDQCKRDAALMEQLGANTIRVYHVDPDADHSGCMSAFADAGIYIFVDMDSFHTYISYGSVPSWNQTKSDAYRAVMDNFQKYDNTGGFFVGNEVLNIIEDSGAAPYVLAAAVDMVAYRNARGYRKIPVGYSATDTGALPMLQDYFVCRPNTTERLEFYSLNSYRWCGQSTYNVSGYNQLQDAAAGYPVPIFFSEVGCITVPPRTFEDQAAIFGPDMDGTWSGSIIYEWIQEMNNYGLITYGPTLGADVQMGSSVIQGFTRQGTPTPVSPDFANLQAQWATLKPTGVMSSAYINAITTKSRTCPAYTSNGWTVDPSSPLPTLGHAALVGVTSIIPSSTSSSFSSSTGTDSAKSSGTRSSGAAASATASGFAQKGKVNPLSPSLLETTLFNTSVMIAFMIAVMMFAL